MPRPHRVTLHRARRPERASATPARETRVAGAPTRDARMPSIVGDA